MKKEIIIVAGGSGGHITPALAVASEFNKKNILFLCSKKALDQKIISEAGYEYKKMLSGKLRRYFSWQNFIDFFLFLAGIFQSFFFLLINRPKIIFSKGGFVSLPVGISAWILRIPFILHESDAKMGLANKILSRFAKKTLTAMPSKKHTHAGTPIRKEILRGKKDKAQKFLNFKNPKKPLIFIIGGSQGALVINKKIKKIQRKFEKIANIAVLTGHGKKIFKNSDSLKAFEFLNKEYSHVLTLSDLVISRAGANSIAEISATKKPCILIPLPGSANNHQEKNAKLLEQKKACIYLSQKNLNEQKLFKTIENLLKNKQKQLVLKKNISKLFNPNSSKKIAEEIKKFL